MFYIFDARGIKKTACMLFIFACIILICRFIILPKILFPQEYSEYVDRFSKEYGLEKSFVFSVIKIESDFEQNAVSHKNAMGLMQITKTTGEWGAEEIGLEDFQVEDLFLPEVNLNIGCWYLGKLITQYNGNTDIALAAYNAGSGNVYKWLNNKEYSVDGENLDVIPFKETYNYIRKVNFVKKIYETLY